MQQTRLIAGVMLALLSVLLPVAIVTGPVNAEPTNEKCATNFQEGEFVSRNCSSDDDVAEGHRDSCKENQEIFDNLKCSGSQTGRGNFDNEPNGEGSTEGQGKGPDGVKN